MNRYYGYAFQMRLKGVKQMYKSTVSNHRSTRQTKGFSIGFGWAIGVFVSIVSLIWIAVFNVLDSEINNTIYPSILIFIKLFLIMVSVFCTFIMSFMVYMYFHLWKKLIQDLEWRLPKNNEEVRE